MPELATTINRQQLKQLLLSLDIYTKPLWGKMNPRQMVEHLVNEVEYSNGKQFTDCDRPPEEAAKQKQRMLYTNTPMPKNLAGYTLPENYRYADMQAAIDQLMRELDDFDEYLNQPGATAVHGGFGSMNYDEWVAWHSKHFAHHLGQFGVGG